MSKNELKKMIVLSSERNKLLIERVISEESAISNRSASALIESHLLNDLRPSHEDARIWIESMYLDDWSVGKVLNACFDFLSAGIDWKARYSNALPIVEFVSKLTCLNDCKLSGKEDELYHFYSQFDSIIDKIEHCLNIEKNDFYKVELQSELNNAKELINRSKSDSKSFRFEEFLKTIIDNWRFLNNYTRTYRLLADICILKKNWVDNSQTRYELNQIIKKASNEWS